MKILMVCLGNICRSPMAEGIMKSKLPDNFIVDSAGTISLHEGEAPDERAIQTAKLHGIDISQQKSRPIQPQNLEDFDFIFCMDKSNLRNVKALATSEKQLQKISLILNILEDENITEVPDPYYGGREGFEKVYQMLNKACDKWAEKFLK